MPQKGRTPRGVVPDDVSEIINFVRNFQGLQRETTEMRLTKKAPLPSIGQSTEYTPGQLIEDGISPRAGYFLDNNNVLDNELAEEDDEEDAAYVSDNERELDGTPSPPVPAPRAPSRTGHHTPGNAGVDSPGSESLNSNRLSRSLDGIPENQAASSRLQPLGQQKKYKSEPGSRRRGKGKAHHLPPMEKEAPPERPAAPRPTSSRSERPKSSYGNRPRSSHGNCRPKSGYGRRREMARPSAPSPSQPGGNDSDGSDPIDFIDSQ